MEPQKTKAPEEEVSRESMSLPIQVIWGGGYKSYEEEDTESFTPLHPLLCAPHQALLLASDSSFSFQFAFDRAFSPVHRTKPPARKQNTDANPTPAKHPGALYFQHVTALVHATAFGDEERPPEQATGKI